MNISFKKTYYDDTEAANAADALHGKDFLSNAKAQLSRIYGTENIFLTTSGSSAMDLMFCALDLQRGGEVIMPSFTFPSAANSALRAGLTPVFADINADTLALSIDDVAQRMTSDTACVMPTHYGGSSSDLDALRTRIGSALLLEDAALSFGAAYKGRPLGTVSDMGIISFHRTKNISADEGGLLIVNSDDAALLARIQTIYDNGTNKQAYERGDVGAYSWQAAGMNAAMPNMCAAVLCAQLEKAEDIAERQKAVYDTYQTKLADTADITLPHLPGYNTNNYHVFYVLLEGVDTRGRVLKQLNDSGTGACFHYMPLHASAMGQRLGYSPSDLPVALDISRRILRLPIHARMTPSDAVRVANALKEAVCQS